MELSDIGSPAAVSRHLVLPLSSGFSSHTNHADTKNEDSDDENHDEGKTSSFCVLLHGALKVNIGLRLHYNFIVFLQHQGIFFLFHVVIETFLIFCVSG